MSPTEGKRFMGNNIWKVTKELKSQTKVFKTLYIFDFFFLVTYISLTYMFRSMVHTELRMEYYIFSILMAIILTLPSSINKKRRNYQSICILIKRTDAVYRPIVVKGGEE